MSNTTTVLEIAIHGGDWDLAEDMSEKLATNLYAAANALTGGTGALVATEGSTTPIHADLSGNLAPRSGGASTYFISLQGEKLALHLANYEGLTIWKYVAWGTDGRDYQRWHPVYVTRYRR